MASANEKYILAVDLGTSGPKVALVAGSGEMIDCEFEPNKLILLPDGGAEQDPDDWWQAIMKAAKKVLDKKIVPPSDVVAICCTAQWSGTVAVDDQGNHLMNAIIWMDSRGARQARALTDGFLKVDGYALTKILQWIRVTGGAPTRSGKDPIAHILYIKEHHPEIYRRTFKFLEPKDYLNLRMTGRFCASYDSIALYWLTDNRDLSRVRYSDKLIRMSGVDKDKLPDLKRAVDILGPVRKEIADELGLGKNVQVVMGTPDVQSAAIGSGAVDDFAAHLYIGTSSWLSCHVPFKKTDLFHNMASLPSAIPNRYFVANEQEVAGKAIDYLLNNLIYHQDELATGPKPENAFQILDEIGARVPPGSGKLIFTPWLYGERTPVDDSTLRGGFFNQSLSTTREHYVRAVPEGVAYNTRWLLKYVEKFIKRPLDRIDFIGGGAQSPGWCQILADVLGRPVRQVADPIQANVRGAGWLGAVGMGLMKFGDIPGRVKIENTYQPNPDNREIYDELFEAFLQLYQQNRKIYARLNRKH